MATNNLIAPTVTANIPGGQFSAPQINDAPARELAAFGKGTEHMAAALFRVELQEKHTADQLRVSNELNALQEEEIKLRYGEGGLFTKKGFDALDPILSGEYSGKLTKRRDEILSGLSNDQQRQMFTNGSNNIISRFNQASTEYLGKEKVRYEISTHNGIFKTAYNQFTIAARNGDHDSALAAKNRMEASLLAKKRLEGWSAAEFDAVKSEAFSQSARAVIGSFLDDGQWQQAERWMNANKDMMSADDMFWSRGHVDKFKKQDIGNQYANALLQNSTTQTSYADIVAGITKQSESGGRRYGKDGKLLTSSKGAKGEMQVKDDTNLDPGFGVKPAKDNSPDERARVGRDYLFAMEKRYDGDMAKAWAAYNWGPGALDKHLKKFNAQQKGEGANALVSPMGWLEGAPKETRNYVTKNMAALKREISRVGQPSMNSADALQALQNITDPVIRNQALHSYREGMNLHNAAKKQQQEEAFGTAFNHIRSGGDISNIPVSVMDALAPAQQKSLMELDKQMKSGESVATDWNVYAQLQAMTATSPDTFSKTDLRAYYPQLAPAQRKHFIDMQAKMKDESGKSEVATLSQQLGTAHNILRLGPKDTEKRGRFDDVVYQAISAEKRVKGRDLTFDERDQIIKRMMLPTNIGLFGGRRMYEVAGTPDEARATPRISSDEDTLIRAALVSEGIEPTEITIRERFNLKHGIR